VGPLAEARAKDVRLYVQEAMMKTMSYTESRARYVEVLDGVTNDREEVIIARAGQDPVVIVWSAPQSPDYEPTKMGIWRGMGICRGNAGVLLRSIKRKRRSW